MKLILFMFSCVHIWANSMPWYSWEDGILEAKKQNMLIWVDLYADWCMPCKVMEVESYGNPEIQKILLENFIPIKIDVDSPKRIQCDGKQLTPGECLHKKWAPVGETPGLPMTVILGPASLYSLVSLKGALDAEELKMLILDLIANKEKVLLHDKRENLD
jgi:thiol-disulfide isomerase/thioredoxin